MVRTALPVITPLGPNPGTPGADALDFIFTAADAVNFNDFSHTGRELILIQNTNVGAQTVTFTSIASNLSRLGTITAYSVGAGEFAAFLATGLEGWRQTDGKFYLTASHAEVKFAIIRLP